MNLQCTLYVHRGVHLLCTFYVLSAPFCAHTVGPSQVCSLYFISICGALPSTVSEWSTSSPNRIRACHRLEDLKGNAGYNAKDNEVHTGKGGVSPVCVTEDGSEL